MTNYTWFEKPRWCLRLFLFVVQYMYTSPWSSFYLCTSTPTYTHFLVPSFLGFFLCPAGTQGGQVVFGAFLHCDNCDKNWHQHLLSGSGTQHIVTLVCLFVVIKPENPYFASRPRREVKPPGEYPPGPRSYPWRSYPAKHRGDTLRANWCEHSTHWRVGSHLWPYASPTQVASSGSATELLRANWCEHSTHWRVGSHLWPYASPTQVASSGSATELCPAMPRLILLTTITQGFQGERKGWGETHERFGSWKQAASRQQSFVCLFVCLFG